MNRIRQLSAGSFKRHFEVARGNLDQNHTLAYRLLVVKIDFKNCAAHTSADHCHVPVNLRVIGRFTHGVETPRSAPSDYADDQNDQQNPFRSWVCLKVICTPCNFVRKLIDV